MSASAGTQHIDTETANAVRRFADAVRGRFDVADIIVFGSRARGTHQPDSDADVAVVLRGNAQRMLPVKLDMADTAFDVLLDTGILISPLPVWLDEWTHPEGHPAGRLLRNIQREGIRL